MEFLIEIVLTIFAELIGEKIESGIEKSRRKKKAKKEGNPESINNCKNEIEKTTCKKKIIIKFETKRRRLALIMCYFGFLILFICFAFSITATQNDNIPDSLIIAAFIGIFVLLIVNFFVIVWILAYKIIFDEEKFTIISGVFPKRIVFHKDLDNMTINKKKDNAVILKFYIKGKKRVRFVSSYLDYDRIKKVLDEFNNA